MSELFAVFKQHLLWSLILWLVVFTLAAAVFARGNLTAFVKGLGRLLLAIFVSPFVFLRRASGGVLQFNREQEEAYRAGDQYLLSKAMMVLQAAVIVIAIGALSAAVVATWNALVPPGEVRQAAREHRPRLEQQRADAASAAATAAKLDSEWSARVPAVVDGYRKEREARIAAATKELRYVETTIATHGNDYLKNLLAEQRQRVSGRRLDSHDDLRYAKNSLDYAVSNNWYWLEEWSRNALNRWNEQWLVKSTAELELRDIPLAHLRREEQPGYEAAAAKSTAAAETLRYMTEQQARLDEAASLKWKAAAWRAGTALVTFLLFVWIAGLLIESGWLAIRVAGDVRRLREAAETRGDVARPPLPAARLPIRESAVTEVGAVVPPAPA